MPLHLEEFQREEFQGYVESVPPRREYALARFFPNKPVFDTEFAYNVISGGYGQMASITGYDAGAPLRDKDVLARMTGELGKVQHAYRLTEKELLMYNRPRMDEEQQQAVESVYDNTDKLVWGVQDREEWFRAKAAYVGAIDYSENDIQIQIDFRIPDANKIGVSVPWTEEGAEVLQDLQAAVRQFRAANNNEAPEEMHISGRVEALLLMNPQVKAQVYGSATDARIVTNDQLRTLFGALQIPPYRVVDEEVRGENGMERLLPEDRVVLIGGEVGRTLQGPTVENNYKPGIYVIPQIQDTNPPKQEVFVGEAVFPALERPGAIVHLVVTV